MKRLTEVLIVSVVISITTPSSVSQDLQTRIGPKAVFHFQDTYDAELNRCADDDQRCVDEATRRFERTALGQIGLCKDDECIARVMRKFGASSEAIAFSRLFGFGVFMTSFIKTGRVSLANAYFSGRMNEKWGIFLVNGLPSPIMDVAACGVPDPEFMVKQPLGLDGKEVDCLKNIDITKHPLYRSLAARTSEDPPPMIWPGHAAFKNIEHLKSGGQRFVIAFDLLGCHACTLAGYAHVAYDFDSSGRFLGTSLLRLTAPAPVASSSTPSAAQSRKRSPDQTERIRKAKQDLAQAADDYRQSLEKLLVFQENDVKAAVEDLKRRRSLFEQNIIGTTELHQSEQALENAKGVVKETRKLLAEATLFSKSAADEANSYSRVKEPYRKETLLKVLRLNALPTQEIATAIEKRGIDFRLTPADELEFASAGATRELLKVMIANYRSQR